MTPVRRERGTAILGRMHVPMRRSRRLPVLATLAFGLLAAPAGAVVGGVETAPGRGTFIVALIDSAEGRKTVAAGQFCAATAVRRDVLITAAHCLEDEDGYRAQPSDLRVFAGRVLPLRKGKLVRVRSLKPHPNFDDGAGEANADVGVIRLREPLAGVTPISVAAPGDAGIWQPGVPLGLWGWGNRAAGEGQNFPRQLHDATVQRFTDARCDDLYGRYFNPPRSCAPGSLDGRVDACQGDSGGPLTATRPDGRVVLVGVVSFGRGLRAPEFPTVYTKLARFRTFLAKATARAAPVSSPVRRRDLEPLGEPGSPVELVADVDRVVLAVGPDPPGAEEPAPPADPVLAQVRGNSSAPSRTT
jgi:trypsin